MSEKYVYNEQFSIEEQFIYVSSPASKSKNKFIKKFRLGMYGEGEDGVTIAEFA